MLEQEQHIYVAADQGAVCLHCLVRNRAFVQQSKIHDFVLPSRMSRHVILHGNSSIPVQERSIKVVKIRSAFLSVKVSKSAFQSTGKIGPQHPAHGGRRQSMTVQTSTMLERRIK